MNKYKLKLWVKTNRLENQNDMENETDFNLIIESTQMKREVGNF